MGAEIAQAALKSYRQNQQEKLALTSGTCSTSHPNRWTSRPTPGENYSSKAIPYTPTRLYHY